MITDTRYTTDQKVNAMSRFAVLASCEQKWVNNFTIKQSYTGSVGHGKVMLNGQELPF